MFHRLRRQPFRFSSFSSSLVLLALVAASTGCGSGRMSSSSAPTLTGNTSVTLLLTSTANDQLSQFDINFSSISLTNQSGKTVNLFTTLQNPEFIHLNGKAEPLLTVNVPQDIYTSATATIGNSGFTCVAFDPSSNGLDLAEFAYGSTPSSQVTVNMPTPITITGVAMGLSLDMQVSQSATYSICGAGGTYSITPTFNLAPVAFSPPLAEPSLEGQIASVDAAGNSFTMALAGGEMLAPNTASANGATLSIKTDNSTLYQGIKSFSSLTVGMLVDMDAAIQADGSQLATRITAEDADTTNLSVSAGPLLQLAASQPTLFAFGRQDQGYLRSSGLAGDLMPYSSGSAVFQVSGRFSNLQALPFVPSFEAANLFAGQNVYVTSHATTLSPGPTYFPATTVTLIPQTINGTIGAVGSDGGFTTYTVALASYDLIPSLAVQPGQTTVLTDPSNVVVYVDGNTQMLNTTPLAAGSLLRFNGLLFNDNGTLRMDCGQVNDGVAE
jgi:hypothetical protein